ncbi:dihydrodipicolinate synthase family protein [Terrabacter sp. MAHUQ-38]|uniref:dihydrodipicolinate synthase family protein n=1 Tax=unclassified Terrabacter TaxID=2630222 RepID=UPI00165EB937|nr:dihydrodipicolinate synthase family protein [Terrabacter sp. MAHUQ-38]MBC9824133.1 dihydrodipicolinate synthase family protein [Terrabacter sp. MAHUQ-38]
MTSLAVPRADGTWERLQLRGPRDWPATTAPFTTRVAFAAAHVVADPLGDNVPGAPAVVDWDSTLAFRRHLFAHGLGVAEAMDTAQRGMGLDWATTQELIARSAGQAAELGARIASGAGTDHLSPDVSSLDEVLAGYEEQLQFVESTGSQAIIMASRQLAHLATGFDDYARVYDRLLSQADRPVILHWLGTAFDPALAGYWGSDDVDVATKNFLTVIADHSDKIDGVKVSLLDADHEKGLRAALPEEVRLYTGDDFNYPELIKGDGTHHSDALLGVFAAIAPAAGAALQALDDGDMPAYDAYLEPTLPLARHVFAAPTYYYKTGIAFLAWLGGHQPGFTMVGGLHSARSVLHLAETLRLADAAGLLPDPDLAAQRMGSLLATAGLIR